MIRAIRQPRHSREELAAIAERRDALVKIVARDIPVDCDLGREDDVLRALYARGYSFNDVDDVLEDAIEAARADRVGDDAGEFLGLAFGIPACACIVVFAAIMLAPDRAMAAPLDAAVASRIGDLIFGFGAFAFIAAFFWMVAALRRPRDQEEQERQDRECEEFMRQRGADYEKMEQ